MSWTENVVRWKDLAISRAAFFTFVLRRFFVAMTVGPPRIMVGGVDAEPAAAR
jgi:hypothetical protein